ncbi:GIY-YIG nuclease family protein [Paenibacillus xerothermodurans]|uniref:Nucleotide excision repair endonuclease n=1 Tax=Paenibacillus xerothermodurans TaxID=1977292 RepID=A0A2W1N529_PAEXE|nr:GIY-YIG nuclease family protein [Paenibacillus xerothermodurans]PZE19799.1 nucleotide excision repair endonuclease [Paenibacillus xerothermodurans]
MSFVFQAGDYPERPGCYLMKDDTGKILYVGKSKNLCSRLRSYFHQNHAHKKTKPWVEHIAAIEVVLVNNEAESLLLENNLIKIHKPPYNRALKRDNSGYAYLQLTDERFPRLDVCYRERRSTARATLRESTPGTASGIPRKRLGPFKSARFRNAMLEFAADHYGLRTCKTMPKQACLLYHINKCSGVCEGKISEEEYRERAQQAASLLENSGRQLIQAMTAKMENYSAALEFEKAANMLRHIQILEHLSDKQIVDRDGDYDQDVLYFQDSHVMIAKVQEGMLRDFELVELDQGRDAMAYDNFLLSRYQTDTPDELIVNTIGDAKRVHDSLRRRATRKIKITQPKRGLKYDLLQLCKSNYEYRINARSM